MMSIKHIPLLFLFILLPPTTQAQADYFSGHNLVCGTTDDNALDLLARGLFVIRSPYSDMETISLATNAFIAAIEKDTLCCDAYFLAGYGMQKQNRIKEAFEYYYFADSLSYNKAPLFKQQYAATALVMGITDVARTKYYEMVHFYPNDPEGYYGVALTATEVLDFENGLKAIDKAIMKYKAARKQVTDDVYLLKAILLSMNKRYEIADSFFGDLNYKYRDSDSYNMYYAYNLVKLSELKNDKKLLKKAKKQYDKIKNKDGIPKEFYDVLDFEDDD